MKAHVPLPSADAILRSPVHRRINPRFQQFILISQAFIASPHYIHITAYIASIYRKSHISRSHIAYRFIAIIKAFIPYHPPMRSPDAISQSHVAKSSPMHIVKPPIISLSHIYKVPCPLALYRCDIAISPQPFNLPSHDPTAQIHPFLFYPKVIAPALQNHESPA